MCIMLIGTVLLEAAMKVVNPSFYFAFMIPCYGIVAFYALQGVFKTTQELVDNSERSEEPYNPEPYQPTEYEKRRAADPNYGKKEQIPEHGN